MKPIVSTVFRDRWALVALGMVLVGIVIAAVAGLTAANWALVAGGSVLSVVGAILQYRLSLDLDFVIEKDQWRKDPEEDGYFWVVDATRVGGRRYVTVLAIEDEDLEQTVELDVRFSRSTGVLVLALMNPARVRVHVG